VKADVDILALRHVPPGWSDVLTYETHWCSLSQTPERPDTVYMRHLDDPFGTLWTVCGYWNCVGVRYDEPGYADHPPYIHPACDEDGNVRMLARHDKAASDVAALRRS